MTHAQTYIAQSPEAKQLAADLKLASAASKSEATSERFFDDGSVASFSSREGGETKAWVRQAEDWEMAAHEVNKLQARG